MVLIFLLTILLNIFFIILLFSPLLLICDKKNRVYIGFFLLMFVLNSIALRLFGSLVKFPSSSEWNWSGKVISILFSIGFILFIKKIPFKEYKLTLRQKAGSKKAVLIMAFAVIGMSFLGFLNRKERFNMDTLLFQLTMPGLDEELCFRGIYLGLLNRTFPKKFTFLHTDLHTEFGWGLIIISGLFGLVHAVDINIAQGFSFNSLSFVIISGFGFLYGFLAESTDSLVLPVLAHNLTNTIEYLIRIKF